MTTTTISTSRIRSLRERRSVRPVPAQCVLLIAVFLLMAWPAVAQAGYLEVEWDAPTTNADGTPLVDLQGYRLYTGTSAPTCPGPSFQAVTAPDPSPGPGDTFPATLTGLASGTTYFVRVSAVDTSGNESACTPAVSGVARTDIAVTPASLSFGNVNVGTTSTLDLTVQNLGVTTLTGTATTASPFSIVSGGSLSVAPGGSQVVQVRFAPLTVQTFAGSVNITTSGDDVSRPVSGAGVTSTPAVLQFSQANYAVTEGGTATITVTRTGGTHGGVTVNYATSNGTATAGSDYTAASGTLTFGANQTSRTFTVATLQNTAVEAPETVTLTLSNAQGGASLGTPNPATLTVNDDDAAGTVQFGAATYSVGEGEGSVTLTVTRTGGTASGATVGYATANGGATAGSDYSARTGTLTFNAGVTSLSIVVPILQDSTFEGPETFTVTLGNPGGGAAVGAPGVATVTINDDEAAPAVLQFSQANYAVTEGGKATVTVTRTGGTHGDVTVQYATGGGSAAPGADYTTVSGTLTFAANQMSRTFTVSSTQDTVVEAAETIGLTLSNPQGGAVLGTPAGAILTVNDNDVAGTVQFGSASYSVGEGAGRVTLAVTRSGGTAGGVTVAYTTANGTATAGSDYEAVTGTLTFNSGATSVSLVVPILQDATPEGPETFTVSLSNPGGGGAVGARGVATVTINDDEPSLRFSAATYRVAETAGLATITVTRVGSTAAALSVDYATTTSGTATPGASGDFSTVTGTLSFAPRQARQTFTVPIVHDGVVDGPKTVGLQLSNPVGAGLGAPSAATLTITDSDVAGTVQFGAARYVADEGAGTFHVPVKRTGGAAAGVTATYTLTGGTAALGVDFTAEVSGTVTFGRGVTLATIPIAPVDDTVLEGPKTLELTLSNPGGGATLGAVRRTVVTIDEVTFHFAPAVYAVTEGDVATITVLRTGPTGRSVTVDWASSDGTATAGVDYVAGSGTLTFPVGVRSRTFTVPTTHDTVMEGAETVLLALRNPSTGSILDHQRTAVLTIKDNDAGGRIAFSAANHVVPEHRGTYNVAVTRTSGLASEVTIDYAIAGGTATGAGVDYTLAAGTLTFAARQASVTIPVTIVDDGIVEPNETIVLQLGNPTGGATLGTPSTSTLTIVDNDRSATLQFGAPTYTVVEGAGSAMIRITRTGSAADPVSVVLTTSDGTGLAGADYAAVNTPVHFAERVTSQVVAVPVMANSVVDGSRTVNLALSNPTAPAALGTPATAVLTIQDDDSTLAFSAPSHSVREGGTVTITVRRTGSALGTVSVGYAVTGGTATATADYATPSARLTFGTGVVTRTLSIRTLADAAVESDETIQLALAAPEGGATIGAPAAATVTITDNPPVVKFGATTYSVSEGKPTATIAVLRTGPSSGTVTVDYGRIGGTAGSGDYTYAPGTLTFTPGVTKRTFTVAIGNDEAAEVPETVDFQLSNAVGAVIGTPGTTTLTIQDNEPLVRFATETYTVAEGRPSATLTVVRTGAKTAPVTVDYARIGGTATGNGTDYTFTPGTLTFPVGVSSRTFTVAITDDALAEAPETVTFRLSNASGASIGTPSTATLTIVDNEPQVRFASAGYTVGETSPGLMIAVRRTGSTSGTVTVNYAVTGGTATNGQDYSVGGAGHLTFGPGVTTQSFTIAPVSDALVEPVETIVLALSNPGNATLGTPAVTTVNITSKDTGGAVQFESPVYSREEGGAEATITVTRRGGLADGVTVDVATVDGSAVAGTDYTAVATTLTFAAGQASASFTVPLIDNNVPEVGRWLELVLGEPAGGATLGAPSSAVLWIMDDD